MKTIAMGILFAAAMGLTGCGHMMCKDGCDMKKAGCADCKEKNGGCGKDCKDSCKDCKDGKDGCETK